MYLLIGIAILLVLLIIYRTYKKCNNRILDAVQKYAPDAVTVLDLGCGSCCHSDALEKLGKTVVSLDVVDMGVCRKPVLFNGSDIRFGDNAFDLGICSFVLHHTRTQLKLLEELKRTCKRVIIIENTPENDQDRYYTDKHAKSHWGGCSACFRSAQDWLEIFDNMRYNIIKVHSLSKWDCPFSDCPWYYPVPCTVFVLDC